MTIEHIPSAAPSLARLINELNKLPGIGPKSAQRLAYYIIRLPNEEAYDLAEAINAVKQNITFCVFCQNLTDSSPCSICDNPQRNREQLAAKTDHPQQAADFDHRKHKVDQNISFKFSTSHATSSFRDVVDAFSMSTWRTQRD